MTPMTPAAAGAAGKAQDASDRELVARLAVKDATALRVLFARHQARVFRFILRLVRNEAVADELTNEVFLATWRNAGKFEGRASLSSWILSIAQTLGSSTNQRRLSEPMRLPGQAPLWSCAATRTRSNPHPCSSWTALDA